MTERSGARPPFHPERWETEDLVQAPWYAAPVMTRRQVMRWSAIMAGALAAGQGGRRVVAGPAEPGRIRPLGYQDEEIQTDAEISVPFNPFGQPVTLDPHRTANWGPFWIMFPNVWGGMVRFTETGQVVEDLAESYSISDDGLVYTFKIRPDAKYANGRPVVADHFISSWKRALSPDNASPMASFMEQVEGYQDYIEKRSEEIGFHAVDDATVEVTLAEPYNYFLSYMATFVWSVVDPQVLEEAGEQDFVLRDAGTGPWRFTEFERDAQFVMEPNTNYYGGVSPSLVKIVWPIMSGPDADTTALEAYRAGEVVSADVPLSLKPEVDEDEALAEELVTISPQGSTRSLAMDFTKAPFDDVRVRRAFALATDRERWANEIWQGSYVPAEVFTPPVTPAISGYEPPDGLRFDIDAAKQALEEAGYPNGEGLPEIVFYQSSADRPEEIERWAAFLQTYEENLGVTIRHDTSMTEEQIEDLRKDEGGLQLSTIWWWYVTETPHLLAEAFRPDAPYMKGYFNWNPDLEPSGDFDPGADAATFEDLMARAEVEQDEATRNDLYRQGEELVLKNAVCVPLGNWVQTFVQKPWLRGTKQGPWTGRLPIRFDQDVVVLQH